MINSRKPYSHLLIAKIRQLYLSCKYFANYF